MQLNDYATQDVLHARVLREAWICDDADANAQEARSQSGQHVPVQRLRGHPFVGNVQQQCGALGRRERLD